MVSSIKELIEEPEFADADDPEERFITSGVNWLHYEALLAKLEENSHYRINYLDGVLEIVSPSFRHEEIKRRLWLRTISTRVGISFMIDSSHPFLASQSGGENPGGFAKSRTMKNQYF